MRPANGVNPRRRCILRRESYGRRAGPRRDPAARGSVRPIPDHTSAAGPAAGTRVESIRTFFRHCFSGLPENGSWPRPPGTVHQRLKDLGYLTTTPDGTYGQDTVIAVKQFQARNDQVVDGYLGPSTRIVLNSSDAKPNGLMIGEQGDSVTRVQQLLSKYGYLPSSNVTGYYGEATEDAVKNFQSRNGLSADGKVGVQTMAKLTSDNVKKPAPTTAASTKSNKSNSSSNKNNSSSKGNSGGNTSSPAPRPASGAGVSALISVASSKLGSPYVWGAKGPSSFDCSGFVYWCLKQVGVSQSYMTSSGWRSAGRYTKVSNFNDIQAGDIVVVRGHVGIAAGGGTVIDASSSNGKVVHRGLSSWWRSNFVCAWRIF